MAFILPPPKSSGGFGQFAEGVAEGLGDDLPELLNKYFTKKRLNNLQTSLDDLGEDASVLDKINLINRSKISEDNKKILSQTAEFEGLQKLLQKDEITPEDAIQFSRNPAIANLVMNVQKRKKEGEKTEAENSKKKVAFIDNAAKRVKDLLGSETYEDMKVEDRLSIRDSAAEAWDKTLDPDKAMELVLGRYRDVAPEGEEEAEEEEKGLGLTPLALGRDASIIRRTEALARGEPLSEYEKRIALPKGANFKDRALYGLGKFMEDFPFYFGGAAAGGAAGGALGAGISAPTIMGVPFAATAGSLIGSGAGAFAVPAMVETGLTLYQGYLEKGGKGSFGNFINAGAQTLVAGVDAGVEGAMFGTLSKLMPLLNKIPVFKKLFNMKGIQGKAAQELVKSTVQSGGILGSRVASGQKVTGDDAVDLFTQVFAFNVAGGLSNKLTDSFATKIEKSGVEPIDFVENVKVRLESQNQDPKNPILLNRAVNDVSKEYSKAKEVFKEAEKPEVGREQLEKSREEKVKLAERISKEPIDEMLKEKKPTKKVKEAMDVVEKTERELVQQRKNIESLEKGFEKAPPKQKKLRQQGIKLAEQEVGRLAERLETEKRNIEAAKPKKQIQTPEQLTQQISRHNEKLSEISKDPGGKVSKDWQRMFERDQKYIKELSERTGEIPSPENIGTGIRILDNYLNAYKKLLKSVEKQIKDLIGPKTAKLRGEKQKQLAKDLLELQKNIKKNIKINEAKQNLRKRKRYVKELAKGKGDAYLKQLVKNLDTTSKEFQKDFVKVKNILDSPEAKVAKLGQEGIQKATSEFVKNPTQEAAVKFEEKTGVPAKEAQEAAKVGKEAGKKIVEGIKKGSPWESVRKKVAKAFEEYNKLGFKKIKKAVIGGIVFGAIQEVVNSTTGMNWPISLISFAFGGTKYVQGIRYGASLVLVQMKSLYRRGMEMYWRGQIKKAPTFQAKSNIRTQLQKQGWSSSRIKKLRS